MVAAAQAVLIALLAASSCRGGGGGGAPARAAGGSVYLRLPTLGGGEVDVTALESRIIVLHVTTTASVAGQADLLELRALRARRPDVALVEVALDPDGALVAAWADAARIDWPVALADRAVIEGETALGAVPVVPTTFVLDGDRRVVWRHVGALPRGTIARVVTRVEGR